jgi:hypothetical protein
MREWIEKRREKEVVDLGRRKVKRISREKISLR